MLGVARVSCLPALRDQVILQGSFRMVTAPGALMLTQMVPLLLPLPVPGTRRVSPEWGLSLLVRAGVSGKWLSGCPPAGRPGAHLPFGTKDHPLRRLEGPVR